MLFRLELIRESYGYEIAFQYEHQIKYQYEYRYISMTITHQTQYGNEY